MGKEPKMRMKHFFVDIIGFLLIQRDNIPFQIQSQSYRYRVNIDINGQGRPKSLLETN